LLAVVVSDKSLVVYDTASWEIKHQTIIPKRANVVKFTPDGEYVVVGDKFGDVYRFSLKSFDKEELILGHVSVLTDLFFSSNGKLIITADRDEKIRVSKFPNGYNIENYCLGHYEFVYQAVPLTSFDGFLVSGGGDDYLNLFNYLTGKHIQKVDLTSIAELSTYTVAQLLQHEGIADRLFVILEGLNALLVFKIDNQDGVPSLSFEQKLEFEQGFEPISVTANKLGQLFVSLYNKETYASQFNGFEFNSSSVRYYSTTVTLSYANIIFSKHSSLLKSMVLKNS
jgi:WD40 repeat protein